MDFIVAKALLEEQGYIYFGARMISGFDFDSPEGERVALTENEIINLAQEYGTQN